MAKMRLLCVEATDQVVQFRGLPCRLWRGTTPAGVPVIAYIATIAVREDCDARELEEGLTRRPEYDDEGTRQIRDAGLQGGNEKMHA